MHENKNALSIDTPNHEFAIPMIGKIMHMRSVDKLPAEKLEHLKKAE